MHAHRHAAAANFAVNLLLSDGTLYRNRLTHIDRSRTRVRIQIERYIPREPELDAAGTSDPAAAYAAFRANSSAEARPMLEAARQTMARLVRIEPDNQQWRAILKRIENALSNGS